jgi:large subunit ribosomal protein L4
MLVPVRNLQGTKVSEIELRDDIFGIEPNSTVMHQAMVRQLSNARLGTHKTKTRGEVSGTTAKWYRQKGTGRARHGSRKAPIFVGGGVVFGPVPHDYLLKMPRKMRRLALRSALSSKAASDQLIVVDQIEYDEPKTKEFIKLLKNLGIETTAVFLLPEANEKVEKSAQNLPNVKLLRASYLNLRDLLGSDYLVLPTKALAIVEEILG